jgi:hypothetical protein
VRGGRAALLCEPSLLPVSSIFGSCLRERRAGQQRSGRRSPTGGVALGAGDRRRGVGSRRSRMTGGATWGTGGRGWPSVSCAKSASRHVSSAGSDVLPDQNRRGMRRSSARCLNLTEDTRPAQAPAPTARTP